MKVLVTGMTSSQAVPGAHKRYPTFAGMLVDSFNKAGHSATFLDPMAVPLDGPRKLIDDVDLVLVGITPFLSLGATYSYIALRLIHETRATMPERLKFFIDTPNASRIPASITQIEKDPEKFTKAVFRNRTGYQTVLSNGRLQQELMFELLSMQERWAPVLVPAYPWQLEGDGWEKLRATLPMKARPYAMPVNVDRVLIDHLEAHHNPRRNHIAYQPGVGDTRWRRGLNVTSQIELLPDNWRIETRTAAVKQMNESRVTVIAPDNSKLTWWSPTAMLSMAEAGTPVYINYGEIYGFKGKLPVWNYLASELENFQDSETAAVAYEQTQAYLDNTPDLSTTIDQIANLERADTA